MSSVVLAKALYNNDSEADDELSFKKGDVITVLETDFEGMVGWWLCSLGEKQGVAPGNRLQLISFDDNNTGDPHDIYDTPTQAHKERYGEVDYDVPRAHSPEQEDYAIPKSPYGNYPVSDSQRQGFVLPSPRGVLAERNSNSSDGLVTNEIYPASSSLYSSGRSSDEFRFSGEMSHGSGSEELYDVPSRNSIESDDGQQNLQPPVIPRKSKAVVSNGCHASTNSMMRQGSEDIYDSPTTSRNSNHSEVHHQLPSDEIYDQLPSNDIQQLEQLMRTFSGGEDYATFPSPSINGPQDIYDVPTKDPEEVHDFPPSSAEDVYDVPPSSTEDVYDVPPSGPEAFYDELPGDRTDSGYKRNSFADGNNNPPVLPVEKSSSAPVYEDHPGEPDELYDNFAEKGLKASTGSLDRKKRHESDDYVDYQEIYGAGYDEKNNKDDRFQKTEYSVLERIHMDKVRELRVSHLVALHNLDKLQQAVDVAVTKLMSFVTDDWRRSEVYALNINGIREIAGKVKVALRLLTEFGLGALKNSQNLQRREIIEKIEEALKPLLESYYSIKNAIQRLDESNWRSAYQETPDDDLNTIAKLSQSIPCGAYNLGAVIANVACILFTEEDSTTVTTKTQNKTPISSPSQKQTTKIPEVRRPSHDSVSPSPVTEQIESCIIHETRQQLSSEAIPSPVTVQVESIKKPVASKMESEPVQPKIQNQASKTPPAVQPKPKKDRKRSDSAPNSSMLAQQDNTQLLSQQVSELTNNLLNQIDTIKTPPQGLSRKGSKKLSPKTVRKLCSITLKNDDKINEKIFEDVSSVPPKPSRQCSTPENTPTNTTFPNRSSLTGTFSDPGALHSGVFGQNGFESMKSFMEKMNSEFMVLKEAIKSFGESVRERQKPKHFVAHSKFIVLSAHRLVYIGDGASRSVGDDKRVSISTATNSLSEVINIFVDDIKIAARQYPEEAAMNNMIKSATNVTEKALGLYKALKRHEQS